MDTGNRYSSSDFLTVLNTLKSKINNEINVSDIAIVQVINNDKILCNLLTDPEYKIYATNLYNLNLTKGDLVLILYTNFDFRMNLKQFKSSKPIVKVNEINPHSKNYGIILANGSGSGGVTSIKVNDIVYNPVEGIVTLPNFITNDVNNLVNYYTKSEVDEMIAQAGAVSDVQKDGTSIISNKIANLITTANASSDDSSFALKGFVNSSISTNTAYFRGTSASGLTEAQFLAWANGLTKTNNDYVFWNTTDASGNVIYKRYKYNGTTWVFEYDLNNSSFTANQWSAINSGITSSKVSTYDGYATTIAGKAPTSHASSATTYGIGTTSNYGHVKLDNSALSSSSTSTDGVACGKGHTHSQYLTSHQDISGKANLSGATFTGNIQIGDSNSTSTAWNPQAIGIVVRDLRACTSTPNFLGDRNVNWYFDEVGPSGDGSWKSIMHIKGWTGSYYAWELMGPASSSSGNRLYFRDGVGTSWNALKTIAFTTDIPSIPSLSVTTSGSGNAVTAISVSGHAITVTKGSTFLTSHQDISGKVSKSGDTMTGTLNTIYNTGAAICFRPDTASYYAGIAYRTSGNEAVCFENINSVTSWIFRTKNPNTSSSEWSDVTPSMQIKNQRVTINKLIANGTTASYNLDVNGSANATTITVAAHWTQSIDSSNNLVFTYA